jgi:hypothetical protein
MEPSIMGENEETALASGPAHRTVELAVALLTILFAAIVIIGSVQVGSRWGADGPGAGFFPFYIGVIILTAGIINFGSAWVTPRGGRLFAQWGRLRRVALVVVPTAIYVALIPWIGIYVSSALLIGAFMKWLGRYGWLPVLVIAVGVPILTFAVFERWFLVPLPKGPLEALLGY